MVVSHCKVVTVQKVLGGTKKFQGQKAVDFLLTLFLASIFGQHGDIDQEHEDF